MAEDDSIQFGIVEIVLPTVSDSQCSIFMDLTSALGVDFNADAEAKVRAAWSERDYKGRLDWDSEADFVGICGGRQAIVDVAMLIHELSGAEAIEARRVSEVRQLLRAFRRPKAKAWSVGDVFAIPLSDASFGYGQILWSEPYKGCSLVLVDRWSSGESHPSLEDILTSPPISITHENGEELDTGEWLIIGHHDPIDDPSRGPCGAPGRSTSNGVSIIANAWRGLRLWNNFYKDDYLDGYLLRGVRRPSGIKLLPVERCATCKRQNPIVLSDDPGGPMCVACESIRRRG